MLLIGWLVERAVLSSLNDLLYHILQSLYTTGLRLPQMPSKFLLIFLKLFHLFLCISIVFNGKVTYLGYGYLRFECILRLHGLLLASLRTAAFHAVLTSIVDALSADAELSLLVRFIFLELDTFLALLFHNWNRVANFLELISWW